MTIRNPIKYYRINTSISAWYSTVWEPVSHASLLWIMSSLNLVESSIRFLAPKPLNRFERHLTCSIEHSKLACQALVCHGRTAIPENFYNYKGMTKYARNNINNSNIQFHCHNLIENIEHLTSLCSDVAAHHSICV